VPEQCAGPIWRRLLILGRRLYLNTWVALLTLALSAPACSSNGEGPVGGQSGGGVTGSGGSAAAFGGNPMQGGAGGSALGGSGGSAASETLVDWYIDQLRVGGAGCLPAELPLADDGTPSCKVFAASSSTAACDCAAQGRAPVSAAITDAVVASLASSGNCDYTGAPACSSFCVCEVQQAVGASKQDCENSAAPASTTSGWCYVAPAAGVGSAPPVANCPANSKQTLRFLGNSLPSASEVFSLACGAGTLPTTTRTVQATPAELGTTCISSSEYDPAFGGFVLGHVGVDLGSAACLSSVCLQNHFQGRVSCPYGQPQSSGPGCLVPGTNTNVTAQEVAPQYVARSSTVASICSCRCAGGGSGPFCSCPTGMQCAPLIGEMGLPNDGDYAGSYCVPDGSIFSATTLQTARCDIASMTCGPPNL